MICKHCKTQREQRVSGSACPKCGWVYKPFFQRLRKAIRLFWMILWDNKPYQPRKNEYDRYMKQINADLAVRQEPHQENVDSV